MQSNDSQSRSSDRRNSNIRLSWKPDQEETLNDEDHNRRSFQDEIENIERELEGIIHIPNTIQKDRVKLIIWRDILINVSLILLWYFFSLLISLYNKWMFSPKHLNFQFPLYVTSFHMIVQFTCAGTILYFFKSLRPPSGSLPSVKEYFKRIGPCGFATGLDIGLSNKSLITITLSFYTMCKSSSLAFVLLFAFLFRLEKVRSSLILIIAIITVGLVMMVATETEFVLSGFLFVMTAAALGGLRWSLTQILLHSNPSTPNPFCSIFQLAPVMFVILFVVAMPMEGFVGFWEGELWSRFGILGFGVLLFPGLMAFMMTSAEFTLIQRTSVVTLSVAGIFKETVTILVSAMVFGDQMTPLNISGLLVTLIGIALYNYIKLTAMKERAEEKVAKENTPRDQEEGFLAGTRDDEEGEPYFTIDDDEDAADGSHSSRRPDEVIGLTKKSTNDAERSLLKDADENDRK